MYVFKSLVISPNIHTLSLDEGVVGDRTVRSGKPIARELDDVKFQGHREVAVLVCPSFCDCPHSSLV